MEEKIKKNLHSWNFTDILNFYEKSALLFFTRQALVILPPGFDHPHPVYGVFWIFLAAAPD